MKNLSTSSSDGLILSLKEWAAVAILLVVSCTSIYFGWFRWERFAPGADYRLPCWAERMSDYWSFTRWCRYASPQYKVFMLGDSVTWGQEVRHDETISHYLNKRSAKPTFANMGIDGLHMAGMRGLVKHHGQYLEGKHVLLQFNPIWFQDKKADFQVKTWLSHPRLLPQFDSRIVYNRHDLNKRLGYYIENKIPLFSLVHHVMVNNFDNKSVEKWVMKNPYENPLGAITFQAAPVPAESEGESLSWLDKNYGLRDYPWLPLSQSVQWDCFEGLIEELRDRRAKPFVMLGPYNPYIFTPGSLARLRANLAEVKTWLDRNDVPYYEVSDNVLPSETFADGAGHLLKDGHDILAAALLKNAEFNNWLDEQ